MRARAFAAKGGSCSPGSRSAASASATCSGGGAAGRPTPFPPPRASNNPLGFALGQQFSYWGTPASLTGWTNASDARPCKGGWKGVKCEGGRVAEM